MKKALATLALIVLALAAYLALWPVPIAIAADGKTLAWMPKPTN